MEMTFGHEPLPASVADLPPHLELTLHVTPDEVAVLGADASMLLDWLTSGLRALVALRNPTAATADSPEAWDWVLDDLDYRLIPRLQGIRDAAIRAHAAAGGSVSHLALAMDVEKSTAQYRRERVLNSDPTTFDTWARTGGPQRTPTAPTA